MRSYSAYYHEQTEEWFTNPALLIGRLGARDTGVRAAREMVEEGQAELIAAVAAVLHVDSPTARSELRKEAYHGPLMLLVDDELWSQLVILGSQELPLSKCSDVDALRDLVVGHYTPLRITNVWMEELVKDFKHLSPQARAHPEGAELRMCAKSRTYPSQFEDPTRVQQPQRVTIIIDKVYTSLVNFTSP